MKDDTLEDLSSKHGDIGEEDEDFDKQSVSSTNRSKDFFNLIN